MSTSSPALLQLPDRLKRGWSNETLSAAASVIVIGMSAYLQQRSPGANSQPQRISPEGPEEQ